MDQGRLNGLLAVSIPHSDFESSTLAMNNWARLETNRNAWDTYHADYMGFSIGFREALLLQTHQLSEAL